MTRYELAQVIARLMAREDQLNAEQKATLEKLAGEYADELANLGVRVSNLEKKVGNISWFGDARMRWKEKGYNTDAVSYTQLDVYKRQPIICYQHVKVGTQMRPPRTTRRKAGTTSSHHAPYALGCTRATMALSLIHI